MTIQLCKKEYPAHNFQEWVQIISYPAVKIYKFVFCIHLLNLFIFEFHNSSISASEENHDYFVLIFKLTSSPIV